MISGDVGYEGIFARTKLVTVLTIVASTCRVLSLNMILHMASIFGRMVTRQTLPNTIAVFLHVLVQVVFHF